jgi:5-dehydro-4-deoxyglucarate dehydratase
VSRPTLRMYCMAPTPFSADGSVDHEALTAQLERMVAAGAGVYPAGPGASEGHSLTPRESREVCETAVRVCGGTVPVIGAPRESTSAREVLVYATEAVAAGVDDLSTKRGPRNGPEPR